MPRGGARPGAGRRKKAITLLKEKTLAEAGADAGYGLALIISVMRDEGQKLDLRLDCAKDVVDRVFGKPTQHHEVEADVTSIILDDRAE